MKNQLPAPFTLTYEGEIVCTPTGFIAADKDALDAYRKEHATEFLKQLNAIAETNAVTDANDITFGEEEGNE